MHRKLFALAVSLMGAGCAQGGGKMKLPLHDAAAHCYAEVEHIDVLGPAVAVMMRHARENASFPKRLEEIMRARIEAVNAFEDNAKGEPKDREESLFVCAANDLLEATFLKEVEQASKRPPDERAARLEFVRKAVLGLELNPVWNEYARKRIADAVNKAHE
jgi:hypothetical protein